MHFDWQAKHDDGPKHPRRLKITTFQYLSVDTCERLAIGLGGEVDAYIIAPHKLSSEGPEIRLDRRGLEILDDTIRRLPGSMAAPPLDQLICISFRKPEDDTLWENRIYDLRDLPGEVRQLLDACGFYRATYFGRKLKKSEKPLRNFG